MMNFPNELTYTKTHEWVKMEEDGTAVIGISDFAQSELGDLVFIDLPQVGDAVEAGQRLCDLESVKAVSEVISPFKGEVLAVNEELADAPERLNEAPYDAWIAKIGNISASSELLDAGAYKILTDEEHA